MAEGNDYIDYQNNLSFFNVSINRLVYKISGHIENGYCMFPECVMTFLLVLFDHQPKTPK